MRRKLLILLMAPAVLMLAASANAQNYVKWDQPPDPAQPENLFYGWNEISLWGGESVAADDWYCDTDDPVSDIHWWGSFIGWNQTEPPSLPSSFHFAIWTDVPAAAGGFSHPGFVLWEYQCTAYTWEFAGWDFDPQTQTYEACFLFHCDLPQSHWFYQEPGDSIYWLSIAAEYGDPDCNADFDQDGSIDLSDYAIFMSCYGMPPTGSCAACDLDLDGDIDDEDEDIFMCQYNAGWPDPSCCLLGPPEYPFGWKTRPRNPDSYAPDAAVRIFDPTRPFSGSQWMSGEPIRWPDDTPENDWDLAFYLTSKQPGGQDYKWRQPPVLNPESEYPDCFWGWDEISDYWGNMGPIVADDWVCVDDRPVTDVHWWGSYLEWEGMYPPEPPMGFYIGVWTDVPAGLDEEFSHPGEMIWMWYVPYETVMETPVGCDWHPDWMMFPETCFYYTYDIPESEWFYQEPGPTIYWLSIAADYPYPTDYPWGWKTRPRDPDSLAPDDAVRIFWPSMPMPGAFWEQGEPIYWPDPEHSWDTAFELTTLGEGEEIIKWYQPPEPYTPDDAYNGWNELSVYDGEQIAGDDWVCENEDPISDVHWWGSFIGWGGLEPPQMPDAFHIGIWTDIPAGIDDWFSHPGDMLWEYVTSDFTWTFAGWDFDPRDPMAPPETCYFFTCDIPRDMWFYQDPGENIYWVTISAIYPDQCACDGDLDDDGDIDLADMALLVGCYGDPTPSGCEYADLDCDGDVDDEDLAIFQCQMNAGWPDPNCCPNQSVIDYPFGMKTRPRDMSSLAPDDAVAVDDPTNPVPGSAYMSGRPLFWPFEENSWDLCFQLTATHEEEPPIVEPKWSQLPECYEGFDAESNLWWQDEQPYYPKWIQTPDDNWPGLHCDITIPLADDWRCGGGMVTDLHWFGNYENDFVGVGLAGWEVEIYFDGGGMPGGLVWSMFVPFGAAGETFTGMYNSEGVPIYKYEYYLVDPFPQEEGTIYWLVLKARSNVGGPQPQWRWQEAGRAYPPILNPAHYLSAAGGWIPLCWANETCTDFAFVITSDQPGIEVNKVVADDFYSDGRDILELRWWGSYFDERYLPESSGDQLHVIDGWFISYHYADYNEVPRYPPELLFDGHPTVLAIYFAPAEAVQIVGLDCTDCNGHALYEYYVDLDACCLVCSHPDPRNNYPPPGQPGAFQEIGEFRYWLDIQAVTGIEWTPDMCEPVYTGHIPPLEAGATGAFWGWHTGMEPADSPGPLNPAATGRIVDFAPYPPDCWDYGMWIEQPWECPTPPMPVNMSFELMASNCPENIYQQDGALMINLADLADLLSRYGSCVGDISYLPAADFNNDGCITLSDLAQLLSVYGQNCPTW